MQQQNTTGFSLEAAEMELKETFDGFQNLTGEERIVIDSNKTVNDVLGLLEAQSNLEKIYIEVTEDNTQKKISRTISDFISAKVKW